MITRVGQPRMGSRHCLAQRAGIKTVARSASRSFRSPTLNKSPKSANCSLKTQIPPQSSGGVRPHGSCDELAAARPGCRSAGRNPGAHAPVLCVVSVGACSCGVLAWGRGPSPAAGAVPRPGAAERRGDAGGRPARPGGHGRGDGSSLPGRVASRPRRRCGPSGSSFRSCRRMRRRCSATGSCSAAWRRRRCWRRWNGRCGTGGPT